MSRVVTLDSRADVTNGDLIGLQVNRTTLLGRGHAEDILEEAADWLIEHEPGQFHELDYECTRECNPRGSEEDLEDYLLRTNDITELDYIYTECGYLYSPEVALV